MTYTQCLDYFTPPQYIVQIVPPVFIPVSHVDVLFWCQVDQLHVLQHFPFLFPEHVQPNYRSVFAEPAECGTVLPVVVAVHTREGDGDLALRPKVQELLNQLATFDAWGVRREQFHSYRLAARYTFNQVNRKIYAYCVTL
jgi:hypothetical protein